jgi:hypothetical protein
MRTILLPVGAVLALAVAVTACRAADSPDEEIAKLRVMFKELEAVNQALRAEVARLKGILYKIPEAKPDKARQDKDLRVLSDLYKALREKPDDQELRKEAAKLARKLGPQLPGNRLVWQVLLQTRTLNDGLSLAEAMQLIGPPTEMSEQYVGWYFNPGHRLHVAPYLHAKLTKEGLMEWKLTNR